MMKIKYRFSTAVKESTAELKKRIEEFRKTECSQEIRYDCEGNEYRKHAIITRFFSYAKDSAFFKTSEIDNRYFLIITLFGGLFGLHFFLRGDYKNGFLYLFTFGGFGIFYVMDVISLCLGNYSFYEVDYSLAADDTYIRTKEKVYIKPVNDLRMKIAAVTLSLMFAIFSTIFLCMPIYRTVNKAITDIASTGINAYVDESINDYQ